MALLHITHRSDVLEMNMDLSVILPDPSLDPARGAVNMAKGTGKCLYLLHGLSDDHTAWQRKTSVERYASYKNLAVVMPTTHKGWYTDMARGPRYFSYLTVELPAFVKQCFPQLSDRREDRYVAGLSMGGYGALMCALRRPDLFSRAALFSGAVDAARIAHFPPPGAPGYFEDVFGPVDQIPGSDNDLFALAERLDPSERNQVKIYQWCGTEDFLYEDNVRMRAHLAALGYPLITKEGRGDHTWPYWDQQIQKTINSFFSEDAP